MALLLFTRPFPAWEAVCFSQAGGEWELALEVRHEKEHEPCIGKTAVESSEHEHQQDYWRQALFGLWPDHGNRDRIVPL